MARLNKQQKEIKKLMDTTMILTAQALVAAEDRGEIKDETEKFMFICYTAIKTFVELSRD